MPVQKFVTRPLMVVTAVTHVIGGTQAMARFCCCMGTLNEVFGLVCSSLELLVQPALMFQHAAPLLTALLLRQGFCQYQHSNSHF